ncbi:MAG TPA: hypothetical protein VHO95_04095 [Candidatus Dormibacteraeota bacterium]|jgi:hypothetical protein|nr:hypothetical protein [Candidatus Dormibacteraeota bacterium]
MAMSRITDEDAARALNAVDGGTLADVARLVLNLENEDLRIAYVLDRARF